MASKYGPKSKKKISKVMHEYGEGKLKSGGSGRKVTSRKQAIAIGISEARAAGGKTPSRKASTSKKSTAKKGSSAKKVSSSKKSTAKKATAKKSTAKKSSAKKSSSKR